MYRVIGLVAPGQNGREPSFCRGFCSLRFLSQDYPVHRSPKHNNDDDDDEHEYNDDDDDQFSTDNTYTNTLHTVLSPSPFFEQYLIRKRLRIASQGTLTSFRPL